MNREALRSLIGTNARDPGCEGAFAMLDQYVEAVSRGVVADPRFVDFLTHLRWCAACREDTAALQAVLVLIEAEYLDP